MSVRKDKITIKDIEAAIQLVAEALELEEASPNTWEEHIAAANRAEEAQAAEETVEEEVTDLSTMSLTDKFGHVINNTLDQLLIGSIVLENAQELRVLLDAVTAYNYSLKDSKSNA